MQIQKRWYFFLVRSPSMGWIYRRFSVLIPYAVDRTGIEFLYSWKRSSTYLVWVWPWMRDSSKVWLDLNFGSMFQSLKDIRKIMEDFDESY